MNFKKEATTNVVDIYLQCVDNWWYWSFCVLCPGGSDLTMHQFNKSPKGGMYIPSLGLDAGSTSRYVNVLSHIHTAHIVVLFISPFHGYIYTIRKNTCGYVSGMLDRLILEGLIMG